MQKFLSGFLLCFYFKLAIAWNSAGHAFVASNALKQLSVMQLNKLKRYNNAFSFGYKPKSLQQAAAWLDWVRCNKTLSQQFGCDFKYYHYIDYPYSIDGTSFVAPYKINALTAIARAINVLKNPNSTAAEKGLQLRILMHVVADLHQPMHTISLFSSRFPNGDRGGNDYLLGSNRVAKNLHAYWDRGGGYLKRKRIYSARSSHSNHKDRFINSYCLNKSMDPQVWAQESYQIAKNFAYKIGYLEKPSKQYQRMVSQISKERLNLAACRLGRLLQDLIYPKI